MSKKKGAKSQNWTEDLTKVDINTFLDNRSCYVIFAVERTPSFGHIITTFVDGADLNQISDVKCLTYESLLNEMQIALAMKVSKNDSQTDKMFKTAVADVGANLRNETIIPVDQLSFYIKLQIMRIMERDIGLEKEEVLKAKKLEAERRRAEDEAAGKKVKASKKQGGGKKGKREADKIDVPYKQLFVAIVGFYEAKLLSALVSVGVPIACVLEICGEEIDCSSLSDLLPSMPVFYTAGSSASLPKGSNSPKKSGTPPLEDKLLYVTNELNESRVPSAACLDNKFYDYCSALLVFWDIIYEYFQSDCTYGYLEGTYHARYLSEEVLVNKEVPEEEGEIVEKNIQTFNTVSEFIRKLVDIHQLYSKYIRAIKLCDLGSKIDYLTARELKIYKTMMDQIPPECFTISLLLYCLIEEVCERINDSNFTGDSYNIRREAISLNEVPEVPFFFPGCFTNSKNRSNMINSATKYTTIANCQFETSVKYENHMSKSNVKFSVKPFTVHEDNLLEIMFNSYQKPLSDYLFCINAKCLALIPPVILLKNVYNELDKMKMLLDEKDLQQWCKQLGLNLSTLTDVIHLLLFTNWKKNRRKEIELTEDDREFKRTFPRRTDSEYLQNFKVNVIDLREKISENPHKSSTCRLRFSRYSYMDLFDIKYCEHMNETVFLQQLSNAQKEFQCFEHKYVPLTDTLLLHYYNKSDEMGTFTEILNQSLRTPVCIRDFCRFILHEEVDWLSKQNHKRRNDVENKQGVDSEGKECHFVFVDKDALNSAEPPVEEEEKIEEKLTEGTAPKDKGADKVEAKSDPKSSKTDVTGTSQEYQKNTCSLRCAIPGDPFHFIGYNLSSTRFQLTGFISSLSTQDGIHVVIERKGWLGCKKLLTLKVDAQSYLMWLHVSENYQRETLQFHFSLPDDSIVVFSRPLVKPARSTLCRQTYQKFAKDGRSSIPTSYKKKGQTVYCVTEKRNDGARAFNIPFAMESNITISESSLRHFLTFFYLLNGRIEKSYGSSPYDTKKKRFRKKAVDKQHEEDKEKEEVEDSSQILHIQDLFRMVDLPNLKVIFPCRKNGGTFDKLSAATDSSLSSFSYSDVKTKVCRPLNSKVLEILGIKNVPTHPRLKICSSALHKDYYVNRVKSFITICVCNIIKRIRVKFPKPHKTIIVSKCYPIVVNRNSYKVVQSKYEVRSSHLSGLMISTIPGFDQNPYQIKQFYIDKGPMSTSIFEEEYRIFDSGTVIIKKCDGSFDILRVDGTTVHFEVPCYRRKESVRLCSDLKESKTYNASCHHKPLIKKKMRKKQRILMKSVFRKRKRLIDGPDTFYYRIRRSIARKNRKKTNRDFCLVQTDLQPFTEFHILTPDGKRIRARTNKVTTSEIAIGSEVDYNWKEILFEREDGTQTLLNEEGELITQFPDKTRIRTTVVETELFEWKGSSNGSSFSLETDKAEDVWVFLSLKYEYDHPHYAKVVYDNFNNSTRITLPSGVVLDGDVSGNFRLTLTASVEAMVTDTTVKFTSKPCLSCPCQSVCGINVEPLYYNDDDLQEKELLNLTDSHGKAFNVNYDGACVQFVNQDNSATAPHCEHDSIEKGKLFVLSRDLSGVKFWDSKLLLRYKPYDNRFMERSIELHRWPDNSIRCIDFKSVFSRNFFEQFLWPYAEPRLWLTKKRPNKTAGKRIAYITKRVVDVLPSSEELAPFYRVVFNAVIKTEEKGTDFQSFIERVWYKKSVADEDDMLQVRYHKDLCDEQKALVKEKLIREEAPKKKQKVSTRKKVIKKTFSAEKPSATDEKIKIKIPFEDAYMECEKQFQMDFFEALSLYTQWYMWYFRCKCCRKQEYESKPRCIKFRKYPEKHPSQITRNDLQRAPVQKIQPLVLLEPTTLSQTKPPVRFSTTKCKSAESVSLVSSTGVHACASDPYLKKFKPDCLKAQSGVPKRKQRSQRVIVCNRVTFDFMKHDFPNETPKQCPLHKPESWEKDFDETASSKQNFVKCFEHCICSKCEKEDLTGRDRKQGKVTFQDEDPKPQVQESACEILDAVKTAVNRSKETICKYSHQDVNQKIHKKSALRNFLKDVIQKDNDTSVSYLKATLLKDVMKDIKKLNLTSSELDKFIQTLDEEFQTKCSNFTCYREKRRKQRKETIIKQTLQVFRDADNVNTSVKENSSSKEKIHVHSKELEDCSSLRSLFDRYSLLRFHGRHPGKPLKQLNTMFLKRPRRDSHTDKVHLSKVLRKDSSLAKFRKFVSMESMASSGPIQEYTSHSTVGTTTSAFSEVYHNHLERDETGSTKGRTKQPKTMEGKNYSTFPDYQSVDELIVLLDKGRKSSLSTEIVGTLHEKITDEDNEAVTNVSKQKVFAGHKCLKASRIPRGEIQECVGTQTHFGKKDAKVQMPTL